MIVLLIMSTLAVLAVAVAFREDRHDYIQLRAVFGFEPEDLG